MKVKTADYLQLTLLLWSRRAEEIDGREAFALYEANWRHIDVDHLTPAEAALIQRLAHEYGGGLLNVSGLTVDVNRLSESARGA